MSSPTEGTVAVIDPTTNTVTNTLTVGGGAYQIADDPSTGTVYIPESGGVAVIGANTDTVAANVAVPGMHGISFDPQDGNAYFSDGANVTVFEVLPPTSGTPLANPFVAAGAIG